MPGVSGEGVWSRHAEQWRWVGAPLRPSPEDTAFAQRAVDGRRNGLRALILGVTPELAGLAWPTGTILTAVDISFDMIRTQWRPPSGVTARAVVGRWQALPLADGSIDLILADGSPMTSPTVEDMVAMIAQAARVLAPGGAFVFRAFLRPDRAEDPARVLAELWANRIGSIHAAKWRLAMALHGPLEAGVVLGEVWSRFREAVPDSAALAAVTGWPIPAIDTLDAYRGLDERYLFPTASEMRSLLAPHFIDRDWSIPGYELGERCPTLVLERR